MRSIDADALKDYFQSLAYDDWNQGVTTSWADAYRECADIVENTPTITPERKRGRWIPQDHNKKNGMITTTVYYCPTCSVCGKTGGYDMSFCPNCGAKMTHDQNSIRCTN